MVPPAHRNLLPPPITLPGYGRFSAASGGAVGVGLPTWQQLVESELPTARSLARILRSRLPREVDAEELESGACLGLIRAAQAFDRNRQIQFRTYASRRMVGAMLDGLRQRR